MCHDSYIRKVPGSTDAVLMIHGICGTPRYFDRLLPCIPENWSVFNILLDGHGGTPKDFSNASMQKWKQQVTETLDELHQTYSRIVIVGHSMGTLLAMHSAPEYPQVTGLFLLNVPLRIKIHPVMVYRLLRLCFHKTDPNHPWELALEQAAGICTTARLWQYLGFLPRFWELLMLCRQSRAKVKTLPCSCKATFSTKDELISLRSAAFFQHNPSAETEILLHSGHFYYAPQDLVKITDALRDFLCAVPNKEYSP